MTLDNLIDALQRLKKQGSLKDAHVITEIDIYDSHLACGRGELHYYYHWDRHDSDMMLVDIFPLGRDQ